jgi:allantoinase
VTPEKLHFRHPVSPYIGQKLRGRIESTIVRGHTTADAVGRESG